MRTIEQVLAEYAKEQDVFINHDCSEEDYCGKCMEAAANCERLEDEMYAIDMKEENDMFKSNISSFERERLENAMAILNMALLNARNEEEEQNILDTIEKVQQYDQEYFEVN